IRRGDEPGLTRLFQQPVKIARSVGGRRVAGSRTVFAATVAPFAFLLTFEVVSLVLPPIRFADDGAVDFEGTADEEPVADEPGVVAALPPEQRLTGPADFGTFLLIEHELLQLFPVVVPPDQDFLHEGVKVGLRRHHGGGRCRKEKAEENTRSLHVWTTARAAEDGRCWLTGVASARRKGQAG